MKGYIKEWWESQPKDDQDECIEFLFEELSRVAYTTIRQGLEQIKFKIKRGSMKAE